jgi:hypothetical protein
MWSVRTDEQLAMTLQPYVRALAIMAQLRCKEMLGAVLDFRRKFTSATS